MEIKNVGLWGDSPQDIVDNYLASYGFKYDKKYSKKDLKKYYDKARNDKELEADFYDEMYEDIEHNATRKEFLYHIRVGLGLKKVG